MSFSAFTMLLLSSLHECLVSGGYNLQPVDPMQFRNLVASSQSRPFPGDLQCLPLSTWNNSSIVHHFSTSDLRVVAPQLWIRSHQIWKRRSFASPCILAKGWLLCRRTRKRESFPQRASRCRHGEQRWAGPAVPGSKRHYCSGRRAVLWASHSPPTLFLCRCVWLKSTVFYPAELCP